LMVYLEGKNRSISKTLQKSKWYVVGFGSPNSSYAFAEPSSLISIFIEFQSQKKA
jgi:hypothetical protein